MNKRVSYFKRALVMLIAITMIFTMMPSAMWASAETAWAEVTQPIEIGTAEDLQALAGETLSGDYRLTANIDMSGKEMSPIKSFGSGTFDGAGFTISNLTLEVSGANTGLFAELGTRATIADLTLKDCNINNKSGSYVGVGGFVGKVTGSSSEIKNSSIIGGTISSSSSSAVYTGGIVGYGNAAIKISGCFSTASVMSGTSSSNRTGGIIGNAAGGTKIENCYAMGTVDAKSGYGGGISGYFYGYSSAKINVSNTYAACAISGTGSKYAFGYCYGSYNEFDNCYYDESINTNVSENTQTGISAKTTEALKAFTTELGGAFQADLDTPINAGYPILKWQNPNAVYSVTLSVEPKDAVVTVNESAQPQSETGIYVISDLKSGQQCAYTVSQKEDAKTDYASQSGTLTVGKSDIVKNITLLPNKYELSFKTVPETANFTLTDEGGNEVTPVYGNIYSVTNGTYNYSAEEFGYKTASGSAVVNRADMKNVEVSLIRYPIQTVTFTYGELTDNEAVKNGKITVKTGTREIYSESDGFTFELPVGYDYEYTFKSSNYSKVEGELKFADLTEEGEHPVSIALNRKIAWEGADDVIEPTKNAEGIYQVSSGGELAWIAEQINLGKNNTCSIVLTNDVDLGNEEWTPIGKNGSFAFKGNFDGQGYTIKNLSIAPKTTASANYGLFGYIDGATVKNLTVEGSITLSGSGSSSYGVGGITGVFYGTTGSIENCVNKVTVKGTQNVGGIAGSISGGYSTANKQIKNCVNYGTITSNSNNAGGIAGYISGQVKIDSCYNRGDCTSGGYRAGGIAAYMNSSSAKVQNCYSTANVSVKYGSDAKAIVGNKSSDGTISNCFYLAGAPTDSNAVQKTDSELKEAAKLLSDSFTAAPAGLNDGYPIFSFQIPTYEVSFNVNDESAMVVIEGQTGTHIGSSWTFKLPDGSYPYEIYAYGKISQNGVINVNGAGVSKNITLETAETKEITFKISPSGVNAEITLYLNGEEVDAESTAANKYTMPYGSYTYQVKAKGYSKAAGTLVVDENSESQITVNLIQTSAWDGETKTQASGNGTKTSPYLIEDGEMLAWFAEFVNGASKSTELYAELTDDIDLGNNPWTPTGKDSHEFQGCFDGKGYTVSGLNVSGAADAGLFGVIKNAEIKNLIVSGSVVGTENAGGIAGRVKETACSFTNCGNDADVSGKIAGGIVGNKLSNGIECTFTNCYNAGNITATERAGGIIGYNNGDSSSLKVSGCYNIGTIASDEYGGGILGGASLTVSDSYNSGKVSGSDATNTGAFSTGKYDVVTNCYYLDGSANDNSGSAAEVSAFELQKLALSDEFEHVSGINRDYPVLKWQGLKAIGGNATLAEDAEFIFEKVPLSVFSEGEEATNMLASTKLAWKAVPGTDKYVITLWKQSFTDEGALEISFAAAITDVSGTKDTNDESKLAYDCKAAFDELEEGVFYASIVPMNADGSYIVPTQEQLEDKVIGWVSPYDRLKKVTNLRWEDGRAYWDAKANFTEEDIYTINLYTVTYEDGAASGEPIYEFFRSYELEGNYSASDFRNIFAAETNYAFTIIAQTSQNYQVRYGLTDSPVSDMSPVYMAGTIDVPTEDHEDWIAISTAKQWVDLANVEDVPSVDGDSNSPSMQAVEWSKNYYLAADIDFSTLSAADQVKTKSIGNVTNRFLGTFDGNGHTIKGLTLSDNDAGLFWYVGSTGYIYDLKVENANVLFSDNAAVIAQMNFGKIEKCSVINCNITADVGAVLGGMVSRNYGIIRESYVQGGSLTSNSISATGHAGFVGASEEGGTIERCWTSMDVNTHSDYAGGFVGLGYGGTIRDCFALGNVSARSYSGGFAGRSVYDGNVYENCYAAGKVTVSGEEGHGFIGGNKPDSAFQYDQKNGIENCYYNAASPTDENGAVSKTADEMKESAFLTALNKNGCWSQEADKNSGLPYLTAVKVPEKLETTEITVELALATYDKTTYEFSQKGNTVTISMNSNGNTRLVDLMDEAVAQGKLTYEYDITTSYGRFIKTINGYSIESPDGWMFTVNDKLSNVSASLATVKDGDKVLWFEGTNENHFQGPTWEALQNSQLTWNDISSVEQLKALAAASDAETLAKNYRLTVDIDLAGEEFSGIGSSTAPFTGIFDGQNHAVSNVKITGASSGEGTGFFNVIKGATVKNFKLTGVEVSGNKKVGSLVGWAQVQLDSEDMTKNIANLIGNCIATGTVQGNEKVGGLVGVNDGKTDKDTLFSIESAMNKVSFEGNVTGKHQVGGLTGENGGAVTAAYAKGTAAAPEGVNDASMIGGLVGDNTGSIYDSYADVKVSGYNVVGGFAGYSEGIVKNCYSLGSVAGSSNVGSFAGSIIKAEYVIGAGQVTRTGASSAGYAGGFAGNMGGTIVGVAAQITIKDAYGNCVGADGTTLETIGNGSSFTSDAQKEVLAQMGLTSKKAVGDKLYEMFGVNLRGLEDEAAKYADTLKVSQSIAVGDIVSLLKTGCTADPEVEVSYSVSGDYLSGGESLKLIKMNDTFAAISVKVDVKLSSDTLGTYNKKVNVIIPVSSAKLQEVMDNIAASYTESSDAWTSMDMIAYAGLSGKITVMSDEAKQNIKNILISEAAESSATASDRSRIEIVLRALGADTNQLYTANSKKKFSNASALRNMDFSNTAIYTAPYILLADLQGNVKLSEAQVNQLIGVIKDNSADGMFGYTYEGVKYDSPDTAGICLAALAKYKETNTDAKEVMEKIIAALPKSLNEVGSFGNANADAMVISGLIAAGYDPNGVVNAAGISVVDGMMSYVDGDGDAFRYPNWSTGELEENAMATEQSFRALVALSTYRENNGAAFNIYDYSKTEVSAAQATGSGSQAQPAPPISDTKMTVYMTVKSDTGTWLARTAISVPSDAKVYDAFVNAIDSAGMNQDGAANGYVKSITSPDGKELAQLDKGPNSGWLYTVNGVLPNVPLTSYNLSAGDEIVWYYTVDYTKDPQAGFAPLAPSGESEVTSDNNSGTTTSATDVKVSEKVNADGTKEKVAAVTVSADNQKEILKQAKAKKSKEIVLQVSKDSVGDASKVDVQLDKNFIESLLKDTDAKLTVKTPLGDKTYTQDELKALAAAATGDTVSIEIAKSDDRVDDETHLAHVKELVGKMDMTARSTKTAKKSIKVTLKVNDDTSASIKELKELGYTVKYKFYRSTKKASKYSAKVTKTSKTYTNTSGKKNAKYYYKARVQVFDKDGNLVAQTALKQCKYACRTWTK